jgi:transposase-like protein
LPRALAKYSKLSPEAVRSLAEEEEKTMTFYDFPQTLHRSIRTTNAIESL